MGFDRIKKLITELSFSIWSVPLALAILVILSYGLLIRQLGYYYDDWPLILVYQQAGSGEFFPVFGHSRPIIVWLYSITTPLVRDDPFRWQIINLFLRWLLTVVFWWSLRQLWPERPRQTTWMAFLFAIYPSFTQQFVSVMYGHIFVGFILHVFSFGAMLKAIREKSWLWGSVACFGVFYSIFSIEYFVGLELARPLMIWLVLAADHLSIKKHLQQTLKYWSPYLIIMIAYAIWRFFLIPSAIYSPELVDQLLGQPVQTSFILAQTMFQDLIEIGVVAFSQTIQIYSVFDLNSEFQIAYSMVVLGVGFLAFGYLLKLKVSTDMSVQKTISERSWNLTSLFFGLVLFAAGGVPAWSVPFVINLDFPHNRLTLAMMLGGSIILVSLLELVIASKFKKTIVLAILVGFAAGFHYQIAEDFRVEWKLQRDYFWQLAWRAPSIAPGTAILGDEFPFRFTDDEAMTAVINQIYDPDGKQTDLPYSFLTVSKRYGRVLPDSLETVPFSIGYGPFSFTGSTAQILLTYYSGNDCLRVLHPEYDDLGQVYPGLLSEVMPWSKPNVIGLEKAYSLPVLVHYYGDEPAHTWCFYYQRAVLAAQDERWEKVVELGESAFERGLTSLAPEELFPFIEGYAIAGDIEQAASLTTDVMEATRTLRPQLCMLWNRVADVVSHDAGRQNMAEKMNQRLTCDNINYK